MAKSRGWGKKFVQKQKRLLEAKLKECLEQRRQVLNNFATIEKDELKDLADLARAVIDQEINRTRANGCTKQIIKVSQAILAIKAGIYGICNNCREPISEKRLKAVPWAAKCTACQRVEELR